MSSGIATAQRRLSDPQPVRLGFFHLVWLFLLLSFGGLVVETIVSFFVDGRWESRAGFVFGPFSPLYGLGGVLLTVAVNPLRGRNVALQFLVAALAGGAVEYFAGWFFETHYGIIAWSYADQPLNVQGHTCAGIMLVWGIAGVLWANLALPHAVRLVERIPERMRRPLTACAFTFILADSVLTLACLDSWFWRSTGHPIENPIQQFCATYFDDGFMRSRFETMSMWPSLASR